MPGNDADQGDEFLRLISAISSYYPFPATAKPDGTWLPTPEPLRLKTVDELRRWLTDMDKVTRLIGSWTLFNSRFEEILAASSARRDAEFEFAHAHLEHQAEAARSPGLAADLRRMGQVIRSIPLRQIATAFFDNLSTAKTVADATKHRLRALDEYQERQPPRWLFVLSFALAIAALLISVFYPIAWWAWQGEAPLPYLRWALLVPLASYALVLIFIISILSRAIPQ